MAQQYLQENPKRPLLKQSSQASHRKRLEPKNWFFYAHQTSPDDLGSHSKSYHQEIRFYLLKAYNLYHQVPLMVHLCSQFIPKAIIYKKFT